MENKNELFATPQIVPTKKRRSSFFGFEPLPISPTNQQEAEEEYFKKLQQEKRFVLIAKLDFLIKILFYSDWSEIICKLTRKLRE